MHSAGTPSWSTGSMQLNRWRCLAAGAPVHWQQRCSSGGRCPLCRAQQREGSPQPPQQQREPQGPAAARPVVKQQQNEQLQQPQAPVARDRTVPIAVGVSLIVYIGIAAVAWWQAYGPE